ncbi:MAG: hypothetical protein N2316_05840 [Spirochaetes bacterium]|nr:hypothetical protein [Spirochaetota bacterium]
MGIKKLQHLVICIQAIVIANTSHRGVYSQELLLRDLLLESDKFVGKQITMRLKLKHVDWTFGKVYFYDKKNFDVAFDISLQLEMEEYRNEIRSLREGMDFEVTFLFQGIGNVGMINGELIKFVPTILQRLPEGESRQTIK